ncbi:MAG: hypothetical protein QXH32_01620 [Candidatus Caldarchaeum sp.]
MKVWSRGLGRVELAIDLKKANIVFDGKRLYIVGKTEPPVSWEFVMSADTAEFWRLARTILNRHGIHFILKFIIQRLIKPREHKKSYEEATKCRTGVKPEQEYAFVLKRTKKET